MNVMLELAGVTAGYGRKICLHDIDLRCGSGLHSLVGANGCGKSTLLRVAAGLMKPRSGELHYGDIQLGTMTAKERARSIAYLPQSRALPDTEVGYFVLMSRFAYTDGFGSYSTADKEAAENALTRIKISHLSGRNMNELSGGERQKVYLAAALAVDSKILLLDEPQTYLDPDCIQFLWSVMQELGTDGRCVICVTHDIVSALRYSDRVAVMKSGELIGDGTPDEVLKAKLISEAFNIELASVGEYYAIK